jgi:NADPH:quinone reductase-like Zn-dependent oxidoreductase
VSHKAKAWFLYAGTGSDVGQLAQLVQEEFELSDIADDELLAEPLYGCWEGNMNHALLRKPIDICKQRGERRVVLGNAGIVRVLEVGRDVKGLRPGQLGMIFSGSKIDALGYTERVWAYDAPGTIGCLATRVILRPHEIVPIPENTRHSLPQWAAFSVRYVTAWANWSLAYGTFRLLVSKDEFPSPNVWGWGGGTTLAELDLAQRHGCTTVMLSGDDRRLEAIARTGVTPLDRRQFGELRYDERQFATDATYRKTYVEAEAKFLHEVRLRTGGAMVQIFVDYIGTPVFRATLKALSRQGIITSAGWKEGMVISFLRAMECIGQHQHINTHYGRHSQGVEAVAYGEAEGWMPVADPRIYGFDEIPELARRFSSGDVGLFPVYSVNAS